LRSLPPDPEQTDPWRGFPYAPIPAPVAESTLSLGAKIVFGALRRRLGKSGRGAVTDRRLAFDTSLCRSEVRKRRCELRAARLLTWVHSPGIVNTYELRRDAPLLMECARQGDGRYDGQGDGRYDGQGDGRYDGQGDGRYDGQGMAAMTATPEKELLKELPKEQQTNSNATLPASPARPASSAANAASLDRPAWPLTVAAIAAVIPEFADVTRHGPSSKTLTECEQATQYGITDEELAAHIEKYGAAMCAHHGYRTPVPLIQDAIANLRDERQGIVLKAAR